MKTRQQEILGLMADKKVPCDVKSLAELHDHVDANELADADRLLDEYGLDESVDILNQVQDRIDRWLRNRDKSRRGRNVPCYDESDNPGDGWRPPDPADRVSPIMERIAELDADQMEDLLNRMAGYLESSAEECDNFNAGEIANHLSHAARIMANRTGN